MELFVVALYAHSASKLAIARINTLHRAQIHIPMPHCAQVHLITDTSTCKCLLPRIIGRVHPLWRGTHTSSSHTLIFCIPLGREDILWDIFQIWIRNYGLDMKKYWWYLHVESNCVLRWGIAKWYTQNAQKAHILHLRAHSLRTPYLSALLHLTERAIFYLNCHWLFSGCHIFATILNTFEMINIHPNFLCINLIGCQVTWKVGEWGIPRHILQGRMLRAKLPELGFGHNLIKRSWTAFW